MKNVLELCKKSVENSALVLNTFLRFSTHTNTYNDTTRTHTQTQIETLVHKTLKFLIRTEGVLKIF